MKGAVIRISTGPRSRTLAFVAALVIAPASQAQAHGDFRLDGLPHYEAGQTVSGTIRNFGFGLGGLLALWEEGFRKLHPGVRFADHLPTSDAAIPALVTGVADLAPDGGEATLTETLSFFETYGYQPTDITVATGKHDVTASTMRWWVSTYFRGRASTTHNSGHNCRASRTIVPVLTPKRLAS